MLKIWRKICQIQKIIKQPLTIEATKKKLVIKKSIIIKIIIIIIIIIIIKINNNQMYLKNKKVNIYILITA